MVVRVNAELNRALALPDAKQRISTLGVEFAPMSLQLFTVEIRPATATWRRLIKTLAIWRDQRIS